MEGDMSLEDSFRELRGRWFNAILASKAHERVWETAEEEEAREAVNTCLRAVYDTDTEAIIHGAIRPVAPRCGHDLRGVLGREIEHDETD